MDNAVLAPCPLCGEPVQHRFALHVSDGNTDDIIHTAPTECGLQFFSVGSADHGGTVTAAWNTRTPDPQVSALVEALEHIAEYWNRDQNETSMADACWHTIETATEALAAWEASQ